LKYTVSDVNGTPTKIQSTAFTQYEQCISSATGYSLQNSCANTHLSRGVLYCTTTIKKTGISLTGTGSGSGKPGYPTWLQACERHLGTPKFKISQKIKAATITFAPTARWLLNLPVEYTYKPPTPPQSLPATISSNAGAGCSSTPQSFTQQATKSDGYEYIHRYLAVSANIQNIIQSVRYSSRTGLHGGAYPASQYGSSSQLLQPVSCHTHKSLLNPNTLPTYSSLSEYTSLFNNVPVCNFDPDTTAFLNWVAHVHQVAPASDASASDVQFTFTQTYHYLITYKTVGQISSTCINVSQHRPPNKPAGPLVQGSCSGTNGTVTFPASAPVPVNAYAHKARSPVVPIDFAYAKEVPYNSAG
jgi:hypothetical protein